MFQLHPCRSEHLLPWYENQCVNCKPWQCCWLPGVSSTQMAGSCLSSPSPAEVLLLASATAFVQLGWSISPPPVLCVQWWPACLSFEVQWFPELGTDPLPSLNLFSSFLNWCWYQPKHPQQHASKDFYSLSTHGVRNHLHLFILNLLAVGSFMMILHFSSEEWSSVVILQSSTEGKNSHPLTTQSDIAFTFINAPAMWKQNTDSSFRQCKLKLILPISDEPIKQQEVGWLLFHSMTWYSAAFR